MLQLVPKEMVYQPDAVYKMHSPGAMELAFFRPKIPQSNHEINSKPIT